MKATLVCPSDRESAAFFARQIPLALVPLLGRSALDRAMGRIAAQGFKEVTILAADRPDQIRRAVREGRPWGLRAEVTPVPLEPHHLAGESVFHLNTEFTNTDKRLWDAPEEWFSLLISSMPEAVRDTVGMREVKPGVWVSTSARVSVTAVLNAPCWIGSNAWLGAGCIVGPEAIVEDGACVDSFVEIAHSFLGPDTYVGSHLELKDSFAWGNGLLNWQNGSFTEVADAFLLADLRHRTQHPAAGSWIERLLAAMMLLLTSPLLILGWLKSRGSGAGLLISHRCVRTPITASAHPRTVVWHELNGFRGMLRRWPLLWSIMKGDFRWIGNHPLTLDQAAQLTTDFERLWLSVPPGLLSLADVEGDDGHFLSDEARAHAAYYAVCHGWRTDLAILWRWLRRALAGHSPRTISASHSFS